MVGGLTGIDGLSDMRRGVEQLSHCLGVPLVFSHSQMEGLEASVGQVAVKRTGHHPNSYRTTEQRKK